MLTGVVALLLVLGPVVAGALPAGPPEPDPAAGSGVTVDLTTENDGHAVSILDRAHPGYAYSGIGSFVKVRATVHLNGSLAHQWQSHLDTPDAYQSIAVLDCRGEEEVPPQEVSCVFVVSADLGLNRLDFRFTADNGNIVVDAVGYLMGGTIAWDAGWEVLDATGQWSAVSHDQAIDLPATMSSALRYVVTNTGGIPLRITDGCSTRLLVPHTQLVCPVRGVRPVQTLAGDYERTLHYRDLGGGTGEIGLDTTIRSFAGVFRLERSSVIVGQLVVVHASGLPRGSFAMQFRLDEQPVLVGTKVTRTGASRLEFPLPSTSQGTAHLRIEHDGIAIANLPFDVTLVPRPPDAAAPVWPWLLLLLVPLAGLLVLLRVRRLRRRAEGKPASPEPPGPGPYPDASPARQEPAAARRS